MIAEAEKYLGFPYVWGGSNPTTSFDCSGFVSWVINHSGWNVGRLTANGLLNISTPVSSANAKPGDLIFFPGDLQHLRRVPCGHLCRGRDDDPLRRPDLLRIHQHKLLAESLLHLCQASIKEERLTMNPKIKKINAEYDKNAAKIAELQARQKELVRQRTELENSDILELVHSHDLDITRLAALIRTMNTDPAAALGEKWRKPPMKMCNHRLIAIVLSGLLCFLRRFPSPLLPWARRGRRKP